MNTIQVRKLVPYLLGGLTAFVTLFLATLLIELVLQIEADFQRKSTSSANAPGNLLATKKRFQVSHESYESNLNQSQHNSDFERLVALRQQLLVADEAKILEMLNESEYLDSQHRRNSTQFEIFRAFASLNPIGAAAHAAEFVWSRQKQFITAIFCEWALNDLPASIEYAQSLGDLERETATIAILDARDDLEYDELWNIANKLGFPKLAERKWESLIVASSEIDPKAAWSSITSDSTLDLEQISSLVSIAEAWIQRDGFEIFSEALESLEDEQAQHEFLSELLTSITHYYPIESFDFAHGDYIRSGNQAFLTVVVSSWALFDSSAALQAVAKISPNSFRRSLQQAIIESWVGSDPQAVIENISTVPREFRSRTLEGAIRYLTSIFPEQAARHISSVTRTESKRSLGATIANEWARNDVFGALDWILNDAELSDMRGNLLLNIVAELTDEDPEYALQIALDQPRIDGGYGLEAHVIERVAKSNIEQAIEMLHRVREDVTKPFAYSKVGTVLVQNDDLDRAIKLGEQLTGNIRLSYYEYLLDDWAGTDLMSLFNSLDSLPSPRVKAIAAEFVRSYNVGRQILTTEQLDDLKVLSQE